MVHQVDALLADAAMMRTRRFYHVTFFTPLGPEFFQLGNCLTPVPQQLLHIAGEPDETLITSTLYFFTI